MIAGYVFDLAVILAGAILNLVRGGAFGADRLPGHPRYLAAAAFAVVALLEVAPLEAAAFGLSFLAWAWLPWGRWFDLGRMPDDYVDQVRPANWFEKTLGLLPSDRLRFTARNLVGLLPAAFMIGPPLAWCAIALLQTAAYELAWRLYPAAPIRRAEFIVGAMWGGALIAAAHV